MLLSSDPGTAADLSTPDSAEPDLSQEPAVFERITTIYRFDNDGRGVREVTATIRIQNQGGVQAFGQLLYPYASANEHFELTSLRVLHPDGSITQGPRAVQELPAPVTAQFPLYSDLHFLHVTAPALKPGDRLEYTVRAEVHMPQAPGHFWLDHDFSVLVPALIEEIELDAPAGRELAKHVVGVEEATVREREGRVIYRWHRTREASGETEETPSVQASTFTSWDEVAGWYWELQHDRLQTTPAMGRKVRELTAALDDETAKVRALYRHVSQEYRYLSLSFGLGRIQPHHASEVFESGYGDCKDKHTLLAALLSEIGVEARPVLISSTEDLVEAVPSPGQFDHLITAIPRRVLTETNDRETASEDWLWLDSTPAVAPFGYLLEPIRDRKALVIAGDARGDVVTTPTSLPFPVEDLVEFRGELSPLGRLSGRISEHLTGDAAVLLGTALLMSTEDDRQEMIRRLATMQDLDGEVDQASHSDPLEIDTPLEVTFELNEPNAWELDGSSRRLTLPQSDIHLPRAPERSTEEEPEPLETGGPYRTVYRFEIELPEGFSATPPIPVSLERSFASYKSTYSIDGSTVRAERIIDIELAEIPPEDHSAWAAFRRAVDSDVDQFFNLRVSGELDVAALSDVEELFSAGKAARKENQYDEAIRLLERVTELDPSHAEAWFELGRAFGGKETWAEAEAAFRRAGELDPFHESAFEYLAWSLEHQDRDDEAIAAYRRQLEVNPLDHYSNDNLGELLVESERYEEAIEYLLRADSIEPDDADTLTQLFVAYIFSGQADRAQAIKTRLLTARPSARRLSSAAAAARKTDHGALAVELYEAAVEEDPEAAWAWAWLGRLYTDSGELETAVAALERAAELEPDEPDHIHFLGMLHFWMADFERAIEYLEPALELEPDDQQIRQSLAVAYTKTGRSDELQGIFDVGEDAEKVEIVGSEAMGFAMRGSMELIASRSDFERASAAFAQGSDEKAVEILDRILARSEHPALASAVALMLAESKTDLTRAEQLAVEAEAAVLQSFGDLDLDTQRDEVGARISLLEQVWTARSWVHFMKLELEEAAQYLRPVVWLSPRVELATHLGQIQEQLGRTQEAKTSYALAMLAGSASTAANNRLDALIGYQAIQPFVNDVAARRRDAMTIRFRPEARGGGEATLRMLVDGNGEVVDLSVTDGDADINPTREMLAGKRFELRFPPGKVERWMWWAQLRCSPYAPECKITLDVPKLDR